MIIGVTFLFIVTSIAPITFGNNIISDSKEQSIGESFDRYLYPEYYDCYSTDEIDGYVEYQDTDVSIDYEPMESTEPLDGPPMDSPWPMHGRDAQHTGRSPYSTIDTWERVWRFETYGWACSSPAVDNEGTIYIGSHNFYAVYPNGTLKWMYDTKGVIEYCCPAIDENGIVYIGTAYVGKGLYAIYTTNGTLKWRYFVGNLITSSPAIGDDGTIYFGDWNGDIHAVYPNNGTLKWKYTTGDAVLSSPAIGEDGIIYCGSHDDYVYALYPNGTLKWRFKTGSWVHGIPTIGDDGTVYVASDDGFLYALYPNNGTLKWRVKIGQAWACPALDKDGTLYIGVWQKRFYAIYPNGTIKWSFNTGEGKVWASSPALSDDGTIYFGTCDLEYESGIEFIALYIDGTVKWRQKLNTFFSSPAIGEDGTVYIGSGTTENGYLNAFGIGELETDANGPYFGLINGHVQFEGYSRGGHSPHSYSWDFGDTHTSDEQNPLHTYTNPGNYTVTVTVTDNTNNSTSDSTWAWIQESNYPPDKPIMKGKYRVLPAITYNYKLKAIDPEEYLIWYYIKWGDGTTSDWIGPYDSDVEITVGHYFTKGGRYTIISKAKDGYGAESNWSDPLCLSIPRTRASNLWYQWFLDRFLLLERLLSLIRVM